MERPLLLRSGKEHDGIIHPCPKVYGTQNFTSDELRYWVEETSKQSVEGTALDCI